MYESSCTPVRHERRDLYRVKDPCTAYHMFIPKTEEAGGFSQLRIEDGIRTRRTREDVADETVGRTGAGTRT